MTINKVLKLSNKKGKVDFSISKDGKEISLKNYHIRMIIEDFIRDVRFAYLQVPKHLNVESNEKGFFSVKVENSKGELVNISTDNVSNLYVRMYILLMVSDVNTFKGETI